MTKAHGRMMRATCRLLVLSVFLVGCYKAGRRSSENPPGDRSAPKTTSHGEDSEIPIFDFRDFSAFESVANQLIGLRMDKDLAMERMYDLRGAFYDDCERVFVSSSATDDKNRQIYLNFLEQASGEYDELNLVVFRKMNVRGCGSIILPVDYSEIQDLEWLGSRVGDVSGAYEVTVVLGKCMRMMSPAEQYAWAQSEGDYDPLHRCRSLNMASVMDSCASSPGPFLRRGEGVRLVPQSPAHAPLSSLFRAFEVEMVLEANGSIVSAQRNDASDAVPQCIIDGLNSSRVSAGDEETVTLELEIRSMMIAW